MGKETSTWCSRSSGRNRAPLEALEGRAMSLDGFSGRVGTSHPLQDELLLLCLAAEVDGNSAVMSVALQVSKSPDWPLPCSLVQKLTNMMERRLHTLKTNQEPLPSNRIRQMTDDAHPCNYLDTLIDFRWQ